MAVTNWSKAREQLIASGAIVPGALVLDVAPPLAWRDEPTLRLGDDLADIEYRRRKNRERAERAERLRKARISDREHARSAQQ